jgi:6-phosphogluconolactonase
MGRPCTVVPVRGSGFETSTGDSPVTGCAASAKSRARETRQRVVLMGLMAASVLSPFGLLAAETKAPGTQLVYFGTYTSPRSKGIYVAQFNPDGGQLSAAELAAETPNPTFLAPGPQGRTLYAVNEVGDFDGKHQGAVSAFRVDARTGKLTLLNQQPSGGSGPCHLAVAEDGKCVLVANYGSGSIAALPIERDGRLRQPSVTVQHQGSSVNHQRQEGPHAHFISWGPENRLVFTCDLGLDKVLIYRLGEAGGSLTPNDPPAFALKPGSGPRHMAFHPDGRMAFILNELSSTLTVCAYDRGSGELKEVQTLSTLPEGFSGANTCAEVAVHPSGHFVYASNRGHDSIAVFAVEETGGKARAVQHQRTGGRTPRHFALDPTAKWLLAENQDSNEVAVFEVNPQTGQLAATERSQPVGAPVCAVFIPKQ